MGLNEGLSKRFKRLAVLSDCGPFGPRSSPETPMWSPRLSGQTSRCLPAQWRPPNRPIEERIPSHRWHIQLHLKSKCWLIRQVHFEPKILAAAHEPSKNGGEHVRGNGATTRVPLEGP